MTASDAQEALIKTVEPIRVACMKRTDARNAVTEVGAEVLTQLSEEVARAGLEQDGPIHLLCTDCRHERRPLCVFEWCIPIANNPHPLSLTHGAILRTLHSFRCVTGTHRGSYDGVMQTVESIVEAAEAAKVRIDQTIQRHVYHEWVHFDSPENVIEVQLALQGQPAP